MNESIKNIQTSRPNQQLQCCRFMHTDSDTLVYAFISPGGYTTCNKLHRFMRIYYNFNEINHADVFLSE